MGVSSWQGSRQYLHLKRRVLRKRDAGLATVLVHQAELRSAQRLCDEGLLMHIQFLEFRIVKEWDES